MNVSSPAGSHEKIRLWIEQRGGHPARAKRTADHDDICIDFGAATASTETISWEEFFRAFDDTRLEFLHKPH